MAHDDADKDAEWDTAKLAVSELPDTSTICAHLARLFHTPSVSRY